MRASDTGQRLSHLACQPGKGSPRGPSQNVMQALGFAFVWFAFERRNPMNLHSIEV